MTSESYRASFSPTAGPLRPRRAAAFRTGQMVSGRASSALGAELLLAQRRRAHLGRPNAIRRRARATTTRMMPVAFWRPWRDASKLTLRSSCPPTRIRFITCGASASSRSTSIRWTRKSKIRSSAPAWPASSNSDLGKTIGYVLPLRPHSETAWTSQPWFTAAPHLFLVPGDSPMGFRLPLDSLPWTKPEDVEYSFEADPVPVARRASRLA